MERNWFCPQCGQPMLSSVQKDNATGRKTYRIGCLNPKHFRTPASATPEIAEHRLERIFGC